MDKDLVEYGKRTDRRIDMIEKHLSDANSSERHVYVDELQRMYEHHAVRVRDFQHERLIHLLVTFFFAGLWLLSVAGGLFVLTLASDPSGPMLNILAWTLCPLLLVTELFYVRHYYRLENGTQRLYKTTERIQALIQPEIASSKK